MQRYVYSPSHRSRMPYTRRCRCMTRRYALPSHFSVRMEFNPCSMPLISSRCNPRRASRQVTRPSRSQHRQPQPCHRHPRHKASQRHDGRRRDNTPRDRRTHLHAQSTKISRTKITHTTIKHSYLLSNTIRKNYQYQKGLASHSHETRSLFAFMVGSIN